MYMRELTIEPKKLSGAVKIPPSKSMAHRAVICAALSDGTSVIDNIDYSDDIIATIDGMKALGAEVIQEGRKLIINGENTFKKTGGIVDCNESGSTLRFLVPLSIAKGNEIKFTGRGNLGKRPLNTYYDIFDKQGIEYNYTEGVLNLEIKGELKGGEFPIEGNISSQFISGLLFTLPLLKEDSKVVITTKLESKGYIDLTLSMMEKFGIVIENNDYKEFIIRGNQTYKATNYKVEGDFSQAAFYLCAGALGNDVVCNDLDEESLQGDKECISILKRMGAVFLKEFKVTKDYSKYESDNSERFTHENKFDAGLGFGKEELRGTVIDASQCPDIIPVVTVVAALSKGETRIINGERLRIKECDRLNAICTELNKLGADITELEDGLIINGVKTLTGGKVSSHSDHRIAMSLAIASTRCIDDIILEDPDCVKKSYPHFWDDFKMLGGKIR